MNVMTDFSKQYQKSDGDNFHIGLALGSGTARGWAHIGVIRALK